MGPHRGWTAQPGLASLALERPNQAWHTGATELKQNIGILCRPNVQSVQITQLNDQFRQKIMQKVMSLPLLAFFKMQMFQLSAPCPIRQYRELQARPVWAFQPLWGPFGGLWDH